MPSDHEQRREDDDAGGDCPSVADSGLHTAHQRREDDGEEAGDRDPGDDADGGLDQHDVR